MGAVLPLATVLSVLPVLVLLALHGNATAGRVVRQDTVCDGVSVSWAECRQALVQKVFNRTTLPDRAEPDSVEVLSDYVMSGWPSPGRGVVPAPPPNSTTFTATAGVGIGTAAGGAGNVATAAVPYAWANGLQRLTWNISSPFISLNSTVHYSFNTSGNAPANYPPPPAQPGHPTPDSPGFDSFARPGRTLVLYHNGHETEDCTPNYDGVVDHLNELGFDVFEFMMPLIGCNQAYQYGNPQSHAWFQQWEDKGDFTMRFFIEPVVLAVNYAVEKLHYDHIVMLGLSGGGWTTTVAAAVDARISLSIPIAGSVPKFSTSLSARLLQPPHWVPDLPEGTGEGEGGGGDFEQNRSRPMYDVTGFLGMYILAAVDPGRAQVQILHEWDSCCFRAGGLHDSVLDYNHAVRGALRTAGPTAGFMQTVVTAGNYHQINVRDKVLVALCVEALRRFGAVTNTTLVGAPFDLLQ